MSIRELWLISSLVELTMSENDFTFVKYPVWVCFINKFKKKSMKECSE